jgi:hypothetical protein
MCSKTPKYEIPRYNTRPSKLPGVFSYEETIQAEPPIFYNPYSFNEHRHERSASWESQDCPPHVKRYQAKLNAAAAATMGKADASKN